MNRPLGVALLSIIAFFIGLVEILRSFLTFSSPVLAFPFGLHSFLALAFPLYLLMGLVWVFIAYSFWKGAEIGWVVGIAMSVLVAVLNYGTYPIETVLAIIVALYLIVPKGVRSWFSKPGISKWAGT